MYYLFKAIGKSLNEESFLSENKNKLQSHDGFGCPMLVYTSKHLHDTNNGNKRKQTDDSEENQNYYFISDCGKTLNNFHPTDPDTMALTLVSIVATLPARYFQSGYFRVLQEHTLFHFVWTVKVYGNLFEFTWNQFGFNYHQYY